MKKLCIHSIVPRHILCRLSIVTAVMLMTQELLAAGLPLIWKQLPSLPDPLGIAGAFAGVSANVLIVGGGANFPGKMPWDGGKKVWHDTVFVLDQPNGKWRSSFKLPMALGYGVSLTTPEGVLCIGGSDATGHVSNVFLLVYTNGALHCKELARLPEPLANSCGALLGHTVFVAGGIDSPNATHALKNFWSLDLSRRHARWQKLAPWPGPPRMLSVAAVLENSFYLVGGTDLHPDPNNNPVRVYLKDAYRFTPGKGWKRIADMPDPVVAAPTPAPVISSNQFLVIGGDDGSLANFEPKSKHPGFPKRVLCYDARLDEWSVVGETPASRATLPAVLWRGMFVMPSGEARPGVRSPEVWAVRTIVH